MKKWIKKWWFSISMFVFALIVFVYGVIMLCLGKIELFYQGAALVVYATMALIIYLIGLANVPRKENK